MPNFKMLDREKFALLAIENVTSKFSGNTEKLLPDGTWVLTRIPVDVRDHWLEWLGSIRAKQLKRSNLVLARKARTSNPGVLDQENEELAQHLIQAFYLLQLSGPVQYDGAHVLKGAVVNGKTEVRQVGKLPDFLQTRGYVSASTSINLRRLRKAVWFRSVLSQIYAVDADFRRVRRGLSVLIDGLRQERGEERLHQFVRSLEALVLPDIGKTGKQFVHRCQTFAKASVKSGSILAQAFKLRSRAEHLNDWDLALESYPEKEREYVAFGRTWQMEKLARFAYSRIFSNATLRSHFRNDSRIHDFWKRDDKTRLAIWGEQLKL